MSVLLVREDREYLLEPGETLETDLGVLELPDDVVPGDTVATHLGEEFTVRRLRGPDLFAHLDRTGAPMLPRDIGLLVGLTGLAAGDTVIDVGTGTGILAAYMGRLGATVVTYECDPSFAAVARANMHTAGVADAVEVRVADATDILGDETPPVDVLTLDTADAPTLVERAPTLLVPGGFVAAYTPFVEDTRAVVEAARRADLTGIDSRETIQREMDFDERGSRPSTAGVGHTGYLTVARRP